MKKLCSLLTCAGLVISMSVFASAAEVDVDFHEVTHPTVSTAKMHTTLTGDTFTTTVVGVGSQATLLVVKGENVNADSQTIQGIDQNGTLTFTYKLRDNSFEPNQKYTIKVGGYELSSPISQVVIPNAVSEVKTTTISGKITNVAGDDNINDFVFEVLLGMTDLPERRATLAQNWRTKIELLPLDDFIPAAKNLLRGEENEINILDTQYATVGTGEYSFTVNKVAADYVLRVSRPGYLTFFKKVIFTGEAYTVVDIDIMEGDVYLDGQLDSSDESETFYNQCELDSDKYMEGFYKADFNCDGQVESTDVAIAFSNSGLDYFESYDLDELEYILIILGIV